MATKTICDHCGGEVFRTHQATKWVEIGYYYATGAMPKKYDLCDKCAEQLQKWMNGGDPDG